MDSSSSPETVVITGASAGIGRAVARVFADHGARIGLLARGRSGLEAARREVEQRGGQGLVLPVDVAEAEAVEQAAATVEQAFGPIDLWINNAMVGIYSPVAATRPAEYRRVIEVTYLGVVHGTLAALRRMQPRDRGTIVQVGSALAYCGLPLQAAYCAAKHAVQGFTNSLRCELLHDRSRVRLVSVHLPTVCTPQFDLLGSHLPRRVRPLPPVFPAELVAQALYRAAHGSRRELEVGLTTALAIAGARLVPGLLERYLARHAYEDQLSEQPEDPLRPDNLWGPVTGDHGVQARGSFPTDTGRKAGRALRAGFDRLVIGLGRLRWSERRRDK